MIIETLTSGRLNELSAFINDCWRHAYVNILDAGFLAGLTTEGRLFYLEGKLRRGLTAELAIDNDGIAGVVMHGPSHFPEYPKAGEINMLYVRPDLIGHGLGHRLLALAESILSEAGYTQIALDVFSANAHAIGFYERHGYAKSGGKTDDIEGKVYALDIMVKVMP